jgi:hypothetical protein
MHRKGHTDPDPDDGPQAARRQESRRKPAAPARALPTGAGKEAVPAAPVHLAVPAAPALALQVRWTAPAMNGGADGLTLPAASGRSLRT